MKRERGEKGGGQQLKHRYKEEELIVKKKVSKHLNWVTLFPVSSQPRTELLVRI